jgi:hypothetical protein
MGCFNCKVVDEMQKHRCLHDIDHSISAEAGAQDVHKLGRWANGCLASD